jgi:hypothetical protein
MTLYSAPLCDSGFVAILAIAVAAYGLLFNESRGVADAHGR